MDKLSLAAPAREQSRRAIARTAGEGRAGDLLTVPQERHSLETLQSAAVLLTVVKR